MIVLPVFYAARAGGVLSPQLANDSHPLGGGWRHPRRARRFFMEARR
jgi:hypothetical protein